jgi:hypothetical protein
MQARVGQLLRQDWNVASIICRMQLSRPHFSQYGQIAGRVGSLECLHSSPQKVSSPEKWPIQTPAQSDVSWSSSFLISFASIVMQP